MEFGNLGNQLLASTFKLGGNTSLSIPALNATFKNIKGHGIGGYISSAKTIVGTISAGAGLAYCLGSVLTSGSSIMNVLTSMKDFVLMLGLDVVNKIYKTVIARVNNILSTIYGIITSIFRAVKSIITVVKKANGIWKQRKDLMNALFQKEKEKADNRRRCEEAISNLIKCLIAKFIEPYLKEFTLKATQKINNIAGKVSDTITDFTDPYVAVADYITQQSNMVIKYEQQIEGVIGREKSDTTIPTDDSKRKPVDNNKSGQNNSQNIPASSVA